MNQGLGSAEVRERLRTSGFNEVTEKHKGLWRKILKPLVSPISLMLVAAAALSFFSGRRFDAYFILALYVLNYVIQKWQEFKVDNAIAQLQKRLTFEVTVLRDGKWQKVETRYLVPGDYIRLELGDVVPADGQVVVASANLAANEAVLTGESLPKNKQPKDTLYSGSFITGGGVEAEVTATGNRTFFGKTMTSIERPAEQSALEKDIMSIARMLTIISIAAVVVLVTVLLFRGAPLEELLTLGLSIVIAGIPVALPAVMAIILSVSAAAMTKKHVLVRRLSALEDLANVNLLITDKTGTLTKNQITVVQVETYSPDYTEADVVALAALATNTDAPDAIDQAILSKHKSERSTRWHGAHTTQQTPFDSDRKRATALVKLDGDKTMLVALGATQAIQELKNSHVPKALKHDVERAAKNGYRALAVAVRKGGKDISDESNLSIIGLIYLADPLDNDAKSVITFLRRYGIGVKMNTGDNHSIAARVSGELGLVGNTITQGDVDKLLEHASDTHTRKEMDEAAAFSEIMPAGKYRIIRYFAGHTTVAATGDGVNDLPPLKAASVSIAVSNAVPALKSAADIVLLDRGLGVIRDAIFEARSVFVRLYNYSVYRISESFRIIITVLILGISFGAYPLQPIQLILLALMNDLPIISLATDRVDPKATLKPAEMDARRRALRGLTFGAAGIASSLLFVVLADFALGRPWEAVQTMFFLKMTVSGHMLIFVAHTPKRWWRFLPSKAVMVATFSTQIVATLLTLTGFLMPSRISFTDVLIVWVWALLWMQVTELTKPRTD